MFAECSRRWIVALPAKNEVLRINDCLVALDAAARCSRLPVSVLVLTNNCTDGTAQCVAAAAHRCTHLDVISVNCKLPPKLAHAGGARRTAVARALMRFGGGPDDFVLSTDADARLRPDTLVAMEQSFARGADLVLARINCQHDPFDPVPLAVVERSRRHAAWRHHVRQVVETLRRGYAPCPPLHDDYGAAGLAISVAAYSALNGFVAARCNEDKLLVATADRHQLRVCRNSAATIDVLARATSRAAGGMADDLARHATAITLNEPLLVEHHVQTVRRLQHIPCHSAAFTDEIMAWEPVEEAIAGLAGFVSTRHLRLHDSLPNI